MTLVSFVSAKGSPGVTQTAAGLALLWPRRAAVADLDPIGGDLTYLLRDEQGEPFDESRGLLSLGAAVRGGADADLLDHTQVTSSGIRALVGVARPSQVQALGASWQHVGQALRRAELDVFADCGRVHPGNPTMAVLERSDAVVFVVRPDVSGVAHLRERLGALREPLRLGAIDGIPVGVAVVGSPKHQRDAEDIEQLLASAGLQATSLGVVAHDPKTVGILHTSEGRAVRRSLLVRSLHDLSTRLQQLLESPLRSHQNV